MTSADKQSELEKPAKVYQLNALEAKVDQVLTELKTIKDQTCGVVTCVQLDKFELKMDEKIAEEVKKIHLCYAPLKSNLKWFYRILVVGVIGIISQIIVIYTKIGK